MSCRNCGETAAPGERFCSGCGSPLEKVTPSKKGRSSRTAKMAVFGVLVLIVIAAVLTILSKDEGGSNRRGNTVGNITKEAIEATVKSPHPWPMPHYNAQRISRTHFVGSVELPGLKWVYEFPSHIRGGPVVAADNTVYMIDGKHVYARNPDGSLKWDYAIPGNEVLKETALALGIDGTIYIASEKEGINDASLYALNPDGTVKWKCGIGKRFIYEVLPGPNGTIFIIAEQYDYDRDESKPKELITISSNGEVKDPVNSLTDDMLKTGISIGPDGTLYGGFKKLYSWNIDGTINWSYDTGMNIGTYSLPVIGDDGTIYVAFGKALLHAVNPDGTLKWEAIPPSGPFGIGSNSPAIGSDGTIYLFIEGKGLVALNSEDGTIKWVHEIRDAISRSIIIDGSDTIYVQGWRIYAIYPDGSLKWSYEWGLGTSRPTSVAIGADNVIYYLLDKTLYAIGNVGDSNTEYPSGVGPPSDPPPDDVSDD